MQSTAYGVDLACAIDWRLLSTDAKLSCTASELHVNFRRGPDFPGDERAYKKLVTETGDRVFAQQAAAVFRGVLILECFDEKGGLLERHDVAISQLRSAKYVMVRIHRKSAARITIARVTY